MKRSTELILGELTKNLGRKHLNSELVEIANDLTEILERNNELKQCDIANVVKSFGCGWNFCDAVLDKKGVVKCGKCNRYE